MEIILMAEEERYSNRQVERLLDEQSRDIKAHIDLVTNPILAQVLKTNGRVTAAEKDITNQKVWRGWVMGGFALAGIFISSLIGLQAWMVVRILGIPETVQAAVDDGFNNRLVN